MTRIRNISDATSILADSRLPVKARLAAVGISGRAIARAARLPESTVSEVLSGKNRNVHRQIDVVLAVCGMMGCTLSVRQLFGSAAASQAA